MRRSIRKTANSYSNFRQIFTCKWYLQYDVCIYTHIYKFIIIAAFANLLLLSIIFKTNIYNCEFFRKICTKIYKMEKLIGKFNKYWIKCMSKWCFVCFFSSNFSASIERGKVCWKKFIDLVYGEKRTNFFWKSILIKFIYMKFLLVPVLIT